MGGWPIRNSAQISQYRRGGDQDDGGSYERQDQPGPQTSAADAGKGNADGGSDADKQDRTLAFEVVRSHEQPVALESASDEAGNVAHGGVDPHDRQNPNCPTAAPPNLMIE